MESAGHRRRADTDTRSCLDTNPELPLSFHYEIPRRQHQAASEICDLWERLEVDGDVSAGYTPAQRAVRIEQQFKASANDESDVPALDLDVAVRRARIPALLSDFTANQRRHAERTYQSATPSFVRLI